MTHIKGIGFSNFRIFDKLSFFDFAPLTIITGGNSSGKSSLFKGLKLLNNNVQDLNVLNFYGEGHKLGNYQLTKSRKSDSDFIRFVLSLAGNYVFTIEYYPIKRGNGEGGYFKEFFISIGPEVKESYTRKELLLKVEHSNDSPDFLVYLNIEYVISLLLKESELASSFIGDQVVRDVWEEKIKGVRKWGGEIVSIEKIRDLMPSLGKEDAKELASILAEFIVEKFSKIAIESLDSIDYLSMSDKTFNDIIEEIKFFKHYEGILCKNLFENSILDPGTLYQFGDASLSDILNEQFLKLVSVKVNIIISGLIRTIKKSLSSVHYLEPIRANSQRLYSNQSQGTQFNDLLIKSSDDWNVSPVAREFLCKWLMKMGIGEAVHLKRVKGIATEVSIQKNGEIVDLIDLGFGVTQFLPILLYICHNFKVKEELMVVPTEFLFREGEKVENAKNKTNTLSSNLLLIEEPEANLHPKLQSLLADFFVDVANNFEVTILLETHSEYLIRRLQVLTAAHKVQPEDIVIYYLNGEAEKTGDDFVTQININPDGSLTNDFGPGFIDEATNWKMELMRLKHANLQNLN